MKYFSEKLTGYIVKSGAVPEESYEIYQYGFQIGLEMLSCLLTCFGIAVYLHMIPEFAVVTGIFMMLRSFVGGVHLNSLIFIGKVRKDPTTRVLIHEKSSLAPPGETMAFKLGDEEGFRWVGAYEISADELLDGKEGKATETKLERGAKLIRELLADKKEISIRELDEKAKEQGISGRTMRDVRSRMKNELEYQVNEKQENSIRLKE